MSYDEKRGEHRVDTRLFEELVELYKKDPEAFERERDRLIAREIEALSPERRRRMRGMQWKIKMVLQKYGENPIARCNAILGLLWDKFLELNASVQKLHSLVLKPSDARVSKTQEASCEDEPEENADTNVIDFPPRR